MSKAAEKADMAEENQAEEIIKLDPQNEAEHKRTSIQTAPNF